MAGLSLSYGKRMKQRTAQEDVKFLIDCDLDPDGFTLKYNLL